MTEQQIKQLAREIVIAQLTTTDDYIDESIAGWPEDFQALIPRADDPNATADARAQAFRVNRRAAERAIEQQQQDEAEFKEKLAQGQQSHQQQLQAMEAQDAARFQKEQAIYDAEKRYAIANEEPFNKMPPKPARTGDELLREQTAGSLYNGVL